MNAAEWLVLRQQREEEAQRRLDAKAQARHEQQISFFNLTIATGDVEVCVPKDVIEKEELEPSVSVHLAGRGFQISFLRDTANYHSNNWSKVYKVSVPAKE
jgi:RNA polymerase-interacting CarD/CdnL/TRCF family regulator